MLHTMIKYAIDKQNISLEFQQIVSSIIITVSVSIVLLIFILPYLPGIYFSQLVSPVSIYYWKKTDVKRWWDFIVNMFNCVCSFTMIWLNFWWSSKAKSVTSALHARRRRMNWWKICRQLYQDSLVHRLPRHHPISSQLVCIQHTLCLVHCIIFIAYLCFVVCILFSNLIL